MKYMTLEVSFVEQGYSDGSTNVLLAVELSTIG